MSAESAEDVTVTRFEGVEDGYLVAFAVSRAVLSAALRVIVALDPWQRRWIQQEQAWWIADDAITLLARRLPAVRVALAEWQARPIDILGSLGASGWATARRRDVYVPRAVAAAYGRLGLEPGAPAVEVAAARRALARRAHPDAGGRHESMVAINAATDLVLSWLNRHGAVAYAGMG